MSCTSKPLNTNNFFRWVTPEAGTTLAALQALGGLPSSLCGEAVEICGLSLSVVVSADSATVKPVFSAGGFPVEMRIEDSNGDPVAGYDWGVRTSITANLDSGNYVAKARKAANFACFTQKPFIIQNVCDIGVDVFVNGSNVLIAHYYDTIEHPTEYQIERKRNAFDPVGIPLVVEGYEWDELPELNITNLPDGDYIAKVRKKSAPSCMASKTFDLKNLGLEVTNFYGQNQKVIQGNVYTDYIDIKNLSSFQDRNLSVQVTGVTPQEINNTKTGSSFNTGTRIISILAGETVRVRFKFPVNTSGITKYPIVTLRDTTTPDATLYVKAAFFQYQPAPSVYIKYNLT